MMWFRRITNMFFSKEERTPKPHLAPRVFTEKGWGTLTCFNENGKGLITFDEGGGQIIRNWDHFFESIIKFETRIDECE